MGKRGKKDIYFRGTWEQRPNFEGNRGTKIILWNREHKLTNFQFLGEQGNKPIYFRGKREQVSTLGGPPKYTVSLFSESEVCYTTVYKPICIWFSIYMYKYDMHIDNMNSGVGVINFSKISSGRRRNSVRKK